MQQLGEALRPVAKTPSSWAERLAMAIRANPCVGIQEWAEREGLPAPTVSRGFRAAFGTSPQRFRLESRTRRAWGAIIRLEVSLTAIAHLFGFADLAHLTRSVQALTGFSPSAWRGPDHLYPGMLSTFKRIGASTAILAEHENEEISTTTETSCRGS